MPVRRRAQAADTLDEPEPAGARFGRTPLSASGAAGAGPRRSKRLSRLLNLASVALFFAIVLWNFRGAIFR